MTSYATLAQDQIETFDAYLRARPFTETERAYWALCWVEVTQPQLDAFNAAMPPNTVTAPRELGGKLYVNIDLLSDAVDSGRLSGIYDVFESLTWSYIDPWEWEQTDVEDWVAWDGLPASLYQVGKVVAHNGSNWINNVPDNVWEPGVYGWKEQTADGTPPAWRQPLGAGDTWDLNDEVIHNSKRWKSLIANNVWEPGGSQWEEVTEDGDGPPPDGPAEWAFPVSYTVGDLVTYQGTTYECRQSHTSQAAWTPPAVLSLWLPQ